ncbi:hypothetical protein [Alteromonas confluentis]|uniref:Glycosyltransferase 2-like domain-containing protein n=1 Tax=Alteromonas confluentis TaxID=1656094 RepID=A0A1E7Z9A8_9ALTE|nr:hypothetical protein [Alteromonas confluentis]OFC70110.1 hypothetical protein BFC18_13030 [Alteromonas confluentis]
MKKIYKDVLVTLTTYGMRLKSVHKTILSILRQTQLPEKIVLWLDEKEFSDNDLPVELTELVGERFEVRYCENMRSFTKLVPSIREFPGKSFITIDDDFEYPVDLIEKLMDSASEFPGSIISARGRIIKYQNSDFLSYPQWNLLDRKTASFSPFCVLPLGYAGVYYPAGALHEDVKNLENFMSVAPHADDLWFKAMGLLNKTSVVVLPLAVSMSMTTIDGTQDNALYLTHNAGDANTEQMRAIVKLYPQLLQLLGSNAFPLINDSFDSEETVDNSIAIGDYAASIVNEIRESAIKLESKNIYLSQKLMTLAQKVRPEGSLINAKLDEYQKIIKGKG